MDQNIVDKVDAKLTSFLAYKLDHRSKTATDYMIPPQEDLDFLVAHLENLETGPRKRLQIYLAYNCFQNLSMKKSGGELWFLARYKELLIHLSGIVTGEIFGNSKTYANLLCDLKTQIIVLKLKAMNNDSEAEQFVNEIMQLTIAEKEGISKSSAKSIGFILRVRRNDICDVIRKSGVCEVEYVDKLKQLNSNILSFLVDCFNKLYDSHPPVPVLSEIPLKVLTNLKNERKVFK